MRSVRADNAATSRGPVSGIFASPVGDLAMSLQYAVTKVTENHYVLPRTGTMKVDTHAFLSEALSEASEETVWQQIHAGASFEGVIGAYLMPDTHTRYGVPVGSVIVTTPGARPRRAGTDEGSSGASPLSGSPRRARSP